MPKPTVFLSYSHKDEDWKVKLRSHLKVLENVGTFVVWDDRKIDAGDTWYDEIRAAMDSADAAVCLISSDYLASDFCVKEEIPYLLKRRGEKGMLMLPVLLRPCPWKYVPWLKAIQMLPRDGKAVTVDFAASWDVAFDQVAESIAEWAQTSGAQEPERSPSRGAAEPEAPAVYRSLPMAPSSTPPPGAWDLEVLGGPPPPDSSPGPRVNSAAVDLFGRDAELSWLDDLWEEGTVRVVSITGPAGIGKTALINTWCAKTEREHGEEACSIRIFDNAGSEPAVAALLAELTQHRNRELLLLASRKPLAELDRLPQELVARRELGPLSPSAGRALLRVGGVHGTDAELEEISRQLGGLPAALVRRVGGIL